ncbi:hypothetical protein JL720_13523 [Aureococcus anophagefferens]|nr:hypothetical protein JL720_13523 [Aureococcus anophagefferens]
MRLQRPTARGPPPRGATPAAAADAASPPPRAAAAALAAERRRAPAAAAGHRRGHVERGARGGLGLRPPWSPSTPGGADGVSTDVVALRSAALLTPAKDDDEPDADDDDAWESVPAPGDDDGGDGATKAEAKDGDEAKDEKDGDKEENVEDKEEKAKDDDKENEAKAGEKAKDDGKEEKAKDDDKEEKAKDEKAKVDDEEKDEKAGDKAKAATPAPETPAKDAHLASRLFDEPSPTSSHASSAKESLASFGDEGSLSGDDASFGEPDRRVVVEGAMVVASDRDDAIASRWVVLRGDALELYRSPHRSKVASHDASHGTALFGAAHVDARAGNKHIQPDFNVDTDECLDSALASASVAGCAVDFAAAFVDDAAATLSDPCRYDADRVFRGDGTGSKTFSQDALPSAVGAFKVVLRYPTRVLLLQPPTCGACVRWVGALAAAARAAARSPTRRRRAPRRAPTLERSYGGILLRLGGGGAAVAAKTDAAPSPKKPAAAPRSVEERLAARGVRVRVAAPRRGPRGPPGLQRQGEGAPRRRGARRRHPRARAQGRR